LDEYITIVNRKCFCCVFNVFSLKVIGFYRPS
jgi:hypothetical protein